MDAKTQILKAALKLFNTHGYSATSITSIRKEAGVSNGSFFHAFSSKDELGAELYLGTLISYHDSVIESLVGNVGAQEGIELMIKAHISWVVDERSQARFLFDNPQSSWIELIRERQHDANECLRKGILMWAEPLTTSGVLRSLPPILFGAQLIGPTQLVCRTWLTTGRSDSDPRELADLLISVAQQSLVLKA